MIQIETTSHDPFFNQAFEDYVFRTYREGDVLLLWRNRPAVVVGCYQNICREVHMRALLDRGIPVVRRMSGGGTVYHDLGNLNYTLISDQTGAARLRPLSGAGHPGAERARRSGAEKPHLRYRRGRQKISGSAQKIAGGRVLHHGTLLFDSDLSLLDEITTGRKKRRVLLQGNGIGHLYGHESAPLSQGRLRDRHVRKAAGGAVAAARLGADPADRAAAGRVRRLADETYHAWDWTWGKTPAFTYEKRAEFAGKPIFVQYEARRGLLRNAEVRSDALDAQALCAMLNGVRLDPALFLELCRTLAGERAEELLDCLM